MSMKNPPHPGSVVFSDRFGGSRGLQAPELRLTINVALAMRFLVMLLR